MYQVNKKATCESCPYFLQQETHRNAINGVCIFYPRKEDKFYWQVCGQHPEYFTKENLSVHKGQEEPRDSVEEISKTIST